MVGVKYFTIRARSHSQPMHKVFLEIQSINIKNTHSDDTCTYNFDLRASERVGKLHDLPDMMFAIE